MEFGAEDRQRSSRTKPFTESMAIGRGKCVKALNEVPGFLLKAPGVRGRREQSLSQAWAQWARPLSVGSRQGSQQHPQRALHTFLP